MRLLELFVLYGLVGVGAAVALVVRRGRQVSPLDVMLVLSVWPLYGPFLLFRDPETPSAPASGGEDALLEELLMDPRSPLVAVLPNPAAGGALLERLRQARGRIAEIDALLATRPFQETELQARLRQLEGAGEARAAAAVAKRLELITRLRGLKRSSERQLTEVRELLAQLHVQAEVVRLVGRDDGTQDLARELVARVGCLEALLEVEACQPGVAEG